MLITLSLSVFYDVILTHELYMIDQGPEDPRLTIRRNGRLLVRQSKAPLTLPTA